jgi:hypothetical protein
LGSVNPRTRPATARVIFSDNGLKFQLVDDEALLGEGGVVDLAETARAELGYGQGQHGAENLRRR